jgi:alkylation response protein AidB-like acyl-CoA dehydrogenase
MSAARAGIQLRGGIGFTWENDTHFWFKRIKSSEVLFGTPQRHREWLMAVHDAREETDHAL